VGELFRLSPLETPLLSLIGGLTGGRPAKGITFGWQDTLHRAPAAQANDEGADATFTAQKRQDRINVVQIFQYGTEISYSKQGGTDRLGTIGLRATPPDVEDQASILGSNPVQDEVSFQTQVLIEQMGLDVEWAFLNETLAVPVDGSARQTQGILGAISTDTTTDYLNAVADPGQPFDRAVINDLSKKLYDNGAPMRNCVIMINSTNKVDLGNSFALEGSGGWNQTPRSYNVFGVNVTDIETEFGRYPVVLNRHLDQNTATVLELDVMAPRFLPIPGKGHVFMEPLAKSGSYDRDQLYGEIGLEYGPAGWHAVATNLHTFV
jgi:hypothetical protein